MLQANDLAIGYPGKAVGAGFDLTLAPGSVLALLGPNGGGKTTLLKTLLGLIPAQGGALTLDGRALAAWPLADRARRIAYVPQAHASPFAYTVRDLVLMGRTAHGGLLARPGATDHAACDAALRQMGIEALADEPANRISGGERQLALIARALAQQSRLVLLDEPTASLDFGNQGKVMRTIRDLAHTGLGVLFSTHDPNHALRFADHALLVREGRTLASGPVRAVLTAPALQQLYGCAIEASPGAFLPG